MRKMLASAFLILAAAAAPLAQAANVDLRVILSGELAPGIYGRVDFGTAPPPPLLRPDPVIIMRKPGPPATPLYLHVPPGHAKNWRKHCHRYGACYRPVYFVKSAEHEPGHKRGKGKREK
ncbi:MAG TPA: hypothetical protein PLK52_01085 [Usitatibacteraceae bacterium]|jgi:hypothetical protein|nr:hypothetical protein [Usitatibacteraceae bacterium]HQY45883.1 hypothetical protein [Usitatibacteraceae bacterium]HRA22117.1 hypothetical protein [Usitatibacteraceae bacterium]